LTRPAAACIILAAGCPFGGLFVHRSSLTRKHYAIPIGIFGLALILRFVNLAYLKNLPFFDHPIMDEAYHDAWARDILAGRLSPGEPFFRAPLYPYLLALVYAVSGSSYAFARAVQALAGSLTCAVTFWLGRRYFGLVAGLVAGLVCALYPVLIYFDGQLLTETPFILLSMACLLLIETARERDRLVLWFAGGLALGLALVTRANIALFLPLAVVGAGFFSKRRLLAALVIAAGIVIPVAPVTVHNRVASAEFIPLVWQGGFNFYLGNNPAASGWSATSPDVRKDWWGGYNDMKAIPREALGRQPSYGEISDFWMKKGLAFVKQHPRAWTGLMLKKVGLFWSNLEMPNNQDYNFVKIYSWVLRNPLVTFGTVAPLGLLGLCLFLPRARKLYFLYGLYITSFVGVVTFFVCDRYRLPSMPPLFIFAGGAAAYLAGLCRQRALMRLGLVLAAIAAAALVVNANLTRTRLPDFAQSYCDLGSAYVSLNDPDRAALYFNKALSANPAWGEAYEWLGAMSMQAGDNPEAARLFLKATQVWPDYAPPYRNLAMVYLAEDRTEEARVAIDTALRLAPFLEDSHNVLGSVARKQGRLGEAESSFMKEIEINGANWRAYANLGSLYEEMNQPGKAVESYSKAHDLDPGNAEVTLGLASLYAKTGRSDLARSLLQSIGSGVSDINLKYNRAVILQNSGSLDEARDLYREILRANPMHEGSLVNLGVIYARQGLSDEALGLWQRALEVNPGNQTAKRNIQLLRQPD
jgi:tetratricopeptide (TPR) repeat protein